MKRLPFVILIVVALSFVAFQTMGKSNTVPPSKYDKVLRLVGEMLMDYHFNPQDINDDFSAKVFKKYIKELDPEKTFFQKGDITILRKYEARIDDEIKGSQVESFLAAGKLFDQ